MTGPVRTKRIPPRPGNDFLTVGIGDGLRGCVSGQRQVQNPQLVVSRHLHAHFNRAPSNGLQVVVLVDAQRQVVRVRAHRVHPRLDRRQLLRLSGDLGPDGDLGKQACKEQHRRRNQQAARQLLLALYAPLARSHSVHTLFPCPSH